MLASESYSRAVDRIRRNRGDKPAEQIMAEVREAFFATLGDLPEGLRHGLFNYYGQLFYERMEPAGGGDEEDERQALLDSVYYLGRVVDVFSREYDDAYPIETDEEWHLIRELTNEYSPELDLGLLTYVMNLLLERGVLG